MAAGDDSAVTGKDAAAATYSTDTRLQANGDHRQVTALGDPRNTSVASVYPFASAMVTPDPVTLLIDAFDSPTFDPAKFTTGGTVPPTAGGGQLNVNPGLGISASSRLQSVATFQPQAAGYNRFAFRVGLEATAATNNHRFWGIGIPTGSPTAANPVQDGIGFEQDQTGAVNFVVFAAGTRTMVAGPLTVTRADALYVFFNRGRQTFAQVAGLDVGSTSTLVPDVQTLPILIQSINGLSAPGLSPTFAATALSVADTGRNAQGISDSVYPTRRVQVTANRELIVGRTDIAVSGTITAADTGSTSTPGAGGQTLVTGTATAGSTFTAVVDGVSSFGVQVLGTFVGTYQIERSLDGVTWTVIGAFPAGTAVPVNSSTLPGVFHGNTSSSTHLRVRCTAFTSGSMAVRILEGSGTGTITVGSPMRKVPSGTGTITSVAGSATSVTVLAANAARLGAMVYNDSTATLYLALSSAAASLTAHTVQVPPGGFYELPNLSCNYTGPITGLWSSATGAARVTEQAA